MSDATSIKLAEGLKERIRAIAADEDRSANWIMNDAIARYVEHKEYRKAVREQMRHAHAEYKRTGLHLTHDEVREWMAKRARGELAPMPKLHT